jgi:hypothetical protein
MSPGRAATEHRSVPRVNLNIMRCEALFASSLRRTDHAAPNEVRDAIEQALRVLGSRGCAAWVAQAYGDFPEAAITRMHWAQTTVARVFTENPNYWEPPNY